jgi:serine/threonine protein phosphatase PrpC
MNHLVPIPFDFGVGAFIGNELVQTLSNADSHLVLAMQPFNESAPSITIAVLARSLNAHEHHGNYYAELTVQTILDSFLLANFQDEVHTLNVFNQSFNLASRLIQTNTREAGVYCLAAAIIDQRLYLANVGACRAFLFRDSAVAQLTTETMLEKLLTENPVTAAETSDGPKLIDYIGRGNVLGQGYVEPDFSLMLNPEELESASIANQGMELYVGDVLVLCNSRFFGSVFAPDQEENTGLHLFRECNTPQEAVDQFIDFHSGNSPNNELTALAIKIS